MLNCAVLLNFKPNCHVRKSDQWFYKHSRLCAGFARPYPRDFSQGLPPSIVLVQLSKIQDFEGSVSRDEFSDFASERDKLKSKLPETRVVQ